MYNVVVVKEPVVVQIQTSLFALLSLYSFFAAKGCAESAIGFGCSRTVPLFFRCCCCCLSTPYGF